MTPAPRSSGGSHDGAGVHRRVPAAIRWSAVASSTPGETSAPQNYIARRSGRVHKGRMTQAARVPWQDGRLPRRKANCAARATSYAALVNHTDVVMPHHPRAPHTGGSPIGVRALSPAGGEGVNHDTHLHGR